MSIYQVTTADPEHPNPGVVADDELDALEQATSAGLLDDGDEGIIEAIAEPEGLEDYEPEGPG
jgi:hypothetical protein